MNQAARRRAVLNECFRGIRMSRMNAERYRINIAERIDTVILVLKAWKQKHNMDEFSREVRTDRIDQCCREER